MRHRHDRCRTGIQGAKDFDKHVLLADLRQENADAVATTLADAGFAVATAIVDIASRASVRTLVQAATSLGEVFGVSHAATNVCFERIKVWGRDKPCRRPTRKEKYEEILQ